MTKRWIMDARSRRSKKYKRLHAELCKEVYGPKLPWWLRDTWA